MHMQMLLLLPDAELRAAAACCCCCQSSGCCSCLLRCQLQLSLKLLLLPPATAAGPVPACCCWELLALAEPVHGHHIQKNNQQQTRNKTRHCVTPFKTTEWLHTGQGAGLGALRHPHFLHWCRTPATAFSGGICDPPGCQQHAATMCSLLQLAVTGAHMDTQPTVHYTHTRQLPDSCFCPCILLCCTMVLSCTSANTKTNSTDNHTQPKDTALAPLLPRKCGYLDAFSAIQRAKPLLIRWQSYRLSVKQYVLWPICPLLAGRYRQGRISYTKGKGLANNRYTKTRTQLALLHSA